MVGDDETVGSVFMTASSLWEFITFCLYFEGYDVVVPSQHKHHGVYAFNLGTAAADEFYSHLQDGGLNLYRNRDKTAIIQAA
jgi:hypothetical protein